MSKQDAVRAGTTQMSDIDDGYTFECSNIAGIICFPESPQLYIRDEFLKLVLDTICVRDHPNRKTFVREDAPIKVTKVNKFEFDTWDIEFDFDIEPIRIVSYSKLGFMRPYPAEGKSPSYQHTEDPMMFMIDLSQVPKDSLLVVYFTSEEFYPSTDEGSNWACKVLNGEIIQCHNANVGDAIIDGSTLTIRAAKPVLRWTGAATPESLMLLTEVWSRPEKEESAARKPNELA